MSEMSLKEILESKINWAHEIKDDLEEAKTPLICAAANYTMLAIRNVEGAELISDELGDICDRIEELMKKNDAFLRQTIKELNSKCEDVRLNKIKTLHHDFRMRRQYRFENGDVYTVLSSFYSNNDTKFIVTAPDYVAHEVVNNPEAGDREEIYLSDYYEYECVLTAADLIHTDNEKEELGIE